MARNLHPLFASIATSWRNANYLKDRRRLPPTPLAQRLQQEHDVDMAIIERQARKLFQEERGE